MIDSEDSKKSSPILTYIYPNPGLPLGSMIEELHPGFLDKCKELGVTILFPHIIDYVIAEMAKDEEK